MRIKKNYLIVAFMIFLIISISPVYALINAYQYSQPNYAEFSASQQGSPEIYWPELADADTCEAEGQDFFITTVPTVCTPAVVRSDLLQDQNVPVFCKMNAIRINPLVDAAEIKSVSFTGTYPTEVAGVSYHPSKTLLKTYNPTTGSGAFNDLGYVVVLLKRQASEKDMPNIVSFNLTATMRYDLKTLTGIDQNMFILPVLTDEKFEETKGQYSFWQGRGYIRAEGVDEDSARISVYSSKGVKLSTFTLQKGKTSSIVYMPGFYCSGGLKVRLNEVTTPKTQALLQIDNQLTWVTEGTKFLDKCTVRDISTTGAGLGEIKIGCSGQSYNLELKKASSSDKEDNDLISSNPQIQQNIDAQFKKAEENADDIATYYSAEEENNRIFGASALIELADTAIRIEKYDSAKKLLEKVINKYPDTYYELDAQNKLNTLLTYDYEDASKTISVGKTTHNIFLKSIKSVNIEDAGAIFNFEGGDLKLSVGKIEKGDDWTLRLVDVRDSNTIIVDYSYTTAEKKVVSQTKTLKERETLNLGGKTFILSEINYKQVAAVSILPELPNQITKVNVSVGIGIEKSGIQLSPDKTKSKIKNLNESIKKYEDIVTRLSNWTDAQSKLCFVTASVLFIKNFIQGVSGKGMARNDAMNGPGGWNKWCAEHKDDPKYGGSVEKCIDARKSEIEKSVNAISDGIQNVNKVVSEAQATVTRTPGATFDDEFIKKFVDFIATKARVVEVDVGDKRVSIRTLFGNNANEINRTVRQMYAAGQITINQMKDIMTYSSFGDESLGANIELRDAKLEIIFSNIEKSKSLTSEQQSILSGDSASCSNKYLNPEIKFYETGNLKGKAAVVPLDAKNGWYVATKPAVFGVGRPYSESGQVLTMYLVNVGPNGREEWEASNNDDRPYMRIDLNTGQPLDQISCFPAAQAKTMASRAREALERASSDYGKKSTTVQGFQGAVAIKAAAAATSARCTDFMSPSDCKLMFNVCDPVICPSSRCNLGGQYPVANVVQSGIIGSTLLCLPNIKEGIIIPVCLTGINEGIKAYVSLLKSHRDCLQESLETGKRVGICDEMYSFYMCEFLWRQATPLLEAGIPKLISAMLGQNRGGGEYMTVNTAWQNMKSSVTYIQSSYTNSFAKIFQARSTEQFGTEFCEAFVSVNYPLLGDLADSLLKPESPVQFHAWFDEIPFSEATVPPTSQYKVYYHIYAGSDTGYQYSVYLKTDQQTGYYATQQTKVVDSGYVGVGQTIDQTKDFTAPAGYKQSCVRINQQEECGFKRVSTSFALDYANDKYMESQATQKIENEDDCISGTRSAYSLLQPSLQSGLEEFALPAIYERGIIRVCSSMNPGNTSDPGRWTNVGYCDKTKGVACWLDTNSVKDAIETRGVEQQTIQQITQTARDVEAGAGLIYDEEKSTASLESASIKQKQILNDINKATSVMGVINHVPKITAFEKEVEELTQKAFLNQQRAKAIYLEFALQKAFLDKLFNRISPTAKGQVIFEDVGPEINFNYRLPYRSIDIKLRFNRDLKGGIWQYYNESSKEWFYIAGLDGKSYIMDPIGDQHLANFITTIAYPENLGLANEQDGYNYLRELDEETYALTIKGLPETTESRDIVPSKTFFVSYRGKTLSLRSAIYKGQTIWQYIDSDGEWKYVAGFPMTYFANESVSNGIFDLQLKNEAQGFSHLSQLASEITGFEFKDITDVTPTEEIPVGIEEESLVEDWRLKETYDYDKRVYLVYRNQQSYFYVYKGVMKRDKTGFDTTIGTIDLEGVDKYRINLNAAARDKAIDAKTFDELNRAFIQGTRIYRD